MMKNKNYNPKVITLAIICLLIGISIGIFGHNYFFKPAINFTQSLNECFKDSDCISVKSGCCGCNAGGSNIAINIKYLDYYEGGR